MKAKKLTAVTLATCLALSALGGLGGAAAQEQKAKTPAAGLPQDPQQVTLQGKIHKNPSTGFYYLRGRTELYGIINPNPEVLEPLAKTGQTVTVAAKLHGDLLDIEKINGNPYPGKPQTGSK